MPERMSGRKAKRLEYAGEELTLKQWEAVTGIDSRTIRYRTETLGWSAEDALTTPVGRGRRPPGRGPVETAVSLAKNEDWSVKLALAVALVAVRDLKDPQYRYDAELFFRSGFGKLFALDGEALLAAVRAMEADGKG